MRILQQWATASRACLSVVVLGCSGCATGHAAFDLFVPSPIRGVEVSREPSREVHWRAEYGREPREVRSYPIHHWLDRTGILEPPPELASCEPLVAYSPAPGENTSPELRAPGVSEEITIFPRILFGPDGAPHYGPPTDHSRATLPDVGCAYFIVPDGVRGKIAFLDREGNRIHEIDLPARDQPLADWRRWAWVPVSILTDVTLIPVFAIVTPVSFIFR